VLAIWLLVNNFVALINHLNLLLLHLEVFLLSHGLDVSLAQLAGVLLSLFLLP
jgi:hypothetical protein